MGEKAATAFRAILILCIILAMIIALALLWYLWGMVAISGSCGFIREVLDENKNAMDSINASDDFKRIMNECFYRVDSTQVSTTKALLWEKRGGFVQYFDGLVRYNRFHQK